MIRFIRRCLAIGRLTRAMCDNLPYHERSIVVAEYISYIETLPIGKFGGLRKSIQRWVWEETAQLITEYRARPAVLTALEVVIRDYTTSQNPSTDRVTLIALVRYVGSLNSKNWHSWFYLLLTSIRENV